MDQDDLFSLLGTMPTKADLSLKVIEEVDCGAFVRKKISYSAEAGEIIPAFLCMPKVIRSQIPAIYCFHQHANNWLLGKSEVVGLAGSPDQAYAKELAELGYITLDPDAISFEEKQCNLLLLGSDDDRFSQNIEAIFEYAKSAFVRGTLERQIYLGKHIFSEEMRSRAYQFLEQHLN